MPIFENMELYTKQNESKKLDECKMDMLKLYAKINNLKPETKDILFRWCLHNAEFSSFFEFIKSIH